MHAETQLYHKGLLVLGLVVSLGFSLSWNPEFHQVGSRDLSSITGASTGERSVAGQPEQLIDAKALFAKADAGGAQQPTKNTGTETLHSFDLEKIDSNQKGLKVFYEIDNSSAEKKVRYYVEGTSADSCTDCLGLGKAYSEPLKEQNVQNIELINRIVGEMALSKISRKQEEAPAESKPTKKKATVTSECVATETISLSAEERAFLNMGSSDLGEDNSVLECKANEYQALAEECQAVFEVSTEGMETKELKQAAADRRSCSNKLAIYYNKFLRKDLEKGLSSQVSSQQNAQAAQLRDAILSTTPGALSKLKADVLKVSQAGLLDRSKAFYNAQMAAKGPNVTAQTIANQTKYNMLMELQSAQSAALCSAYSGVDASQCMAANTNPALRAALSQQNAGFNSFNQSYLSPIEKFATTSNTTGDPGFDTFIAQMNMNSSSDLGISAGTDPNLNKMPVPDGFYDARTNVLNRGGQQGALLPLPGSAANSGANTQGQVLLPLNQTNNIPLAPAINPAAATRPNIIYPTTQGQLAPRTAPASPAAPIYQPATAPAIYPTLPATSNAIRR